MMAAALGIALFASPVRAQDAQASAPPPPASPAPAIDPSKLGVDLNRIQKGLAAPVTEQRTDNGLRVDYHIEVFGKAPVPNFFENFDPVVGPVPFGAPTHKDFLAMVTPEAFRAPTMNFSALAFWAVGKLAERSKRAQCDEDLARYKADVMAGRQVSAPACAR